MLHKEIWGLTLLGFIVWAILTTDGSSRIHNACAPLGWLGNVGVSITALIASSQEEHVQHWVDRGQYSCEYTLWRLFYEKKYNNYMRQQIAAAQAPAPVASSAPDSAAVPGKN